jgi:hypothetical protein
MKFLREHALLVVGLILFSLALMLSCPASYAQVVVDPCMQPYAKSSVPVVATGQLVAAAATKAVYVCGFYVTMGGTTPSVKFQYGTGTNCATNPIDLTGAFAATVGQEIFFGHGSTVMSTPTGQALCIVTAGTSPTIAGVMSYVQQ